MLTGHDIIYISSIEWSFLWQPHQEIARRLARAGNRVLYIENTGVRSPGLGDAGRVLSRLTSWIGSLRSQGVREVAPRLYVVSPLVLPPFGSAARKLINRHLLLPLMRRVAQRLKMRDVLVWSYLPTDTVLDLIALMQTKRSATLYYCMADFPQLTPDSQHILESERLLVERSDVVFANCAKIATRLSQWADQVSIFPPGVNLDAFPPEDFEQKASQTSSLDALPRPIIGYIGGLHRHVDFELVAEAAKARPTWSWVFVGPLQTSVEKLQGHPNIHLVGSTPHEELAAYVRNFDVCIVPYLQSAYTETVVPVKINEYLAAGKPVVSTDLPTVKEFNAQHQILITTANRSEPFVAGIEEALGQPKNAEVVRRRREVASLYDWNTQIEAMSQLIERKLKQNTR
ncbi:MAG TPA: glycosyltransferase [Pyrinomonadaceae bacterium]|nr:glycosyltransferase [Pyrinomonadaceae bacterium]